MGDFKTERFIKGGALENMINNNERRYYVNRSENGK